MPSHSMGSISEFGDLLSSPDLDDDAIEAALILVEPRDGSSVNWWLGLLQAAEMRLHAALAASERGREWAEHLLKLLGIGVRHDAVEGYEAEWLIANIALFLRNDSPDERPPSLMPDQVVCRLMPRLKSLLPSAMGPEGWRNLPVEEMRRLRKAKNLLSPLAGLRDDLVDPVLKDDLDQYFRALPKLP